MRYEFVPWDKQFFLTIRLGEQTFLTYRGGGQTFVNTEGRQTFFHKWMGTNIFTHREEKTFSHTGGGQTFLHTEILFIYQQVHSITARSVPREFRESLKLGKPEATDSIFKLPEAKQWEGQASTEKDNIIKVLLSTICVPTICYYYCRQLLCTQVRRRVTVMIQNKGTVVRTVTIQPGKIGTQQSSILLCYTFYSPCSTLLFC